MSGLLSNAGGAATDHDLAHPTFKLKNLQKGDFCQG